MYRFISKSLNLYFRLFHRMDVHNLSQFKDDEVPLILASNHSSNLDPLVVLGAFCNSRELNFIAKDSLFKYKFTNYVLRKMNAFPVNRNSKDFGAIKAANRVLRSNKVLGIFPEGTRNKEFGNLKNGFAIFSIKNKANILPVHVKYSKGFLFRKVDVYVLDEIQAPEFNKETLDLDMENLKNTFVEKIKNNMCSF